MELTHSPLSCVPTDVIRCTCRDASAVRAWLASELRLEEVAVGAQAAEIDGATALEMDKEDWKELGATGIQSSKIVGALKKLGV